MTHILTEREVILEELFRPRIERFSMYNPGDIVEVQQELSGVHGVYVSKRHDTHLYIVVSLPAGRIVRIGVDSRFQRKGRGRELLDIAEETLRGVGCRWVHVASLSSACGFYEACGYVRQQEYEGLPRFSKQF